jgi:hypothetical protein
MVEIWVFVSCGAALNPLRDGALQVIAAVERMFVFGLSVSVVLRNWDWRNEPPEIVGSNEFAARSLRMVERSNAVVAILADTIPPTTRKEIHGAIRQFASGRTDQVWVFVDNTAKNEAHARFVQNIRRRHKVQVIYQGYDAELDFQEKLFVALIPYVVRKTILDEQAQVESSAGASL